MKLLVLQQDEYDDAGSIIEWAFRRAHTLKTIVLTKGEALPAALPGEMTGALPEALDFDILFIMGGTMNVDEEGEFPWLAEEKAFIKRVIDAGKIVVGFCLGGQLIACALGGKVTKSAEPELGWHKVNFNKTAQTHPVLSVFGESAVIFQWHGDTFSVLPEGAALIAENPACAHHGFIYGNNVYAFQFHLELTYQMLYFFARQHESPQYQGPFVQRSDEIIKNYEYLLSNNKLMFDFLDRLVSIAPI